MPKVTKSTTVKERHWGPDDDYLVVEVQVFSIEGFKEGDNVSVTIEKKEETCKGHGYPCDSCGTSNCPERIAPPSPSREDILMRHGATEEDIDRGPRED